MESPNDSTLSWQCLGFHSESCVLTMGWTDACNEVHNLQVQSHEPSVRLTGYGITYEYYHNISKVIYLVVDSSNM